MYYEQACGGLSSTSTCLWVLVEKGNRNSGLWGYPCLPEESPHRWRSLWPDGSGGEGQHQC